MWGQERLCPCVWSDLWAFEAPGKTSCPDSPGQEQEEVGKPGSQQQAWLLGFVSWSPVPAFCQELAVAEKPFSFQGLNPQQHSKGHAAKLTFPRTVHTHISITLVIIPTKVRRNFEGGLK